MKKVKGKEEKLKEALRIAIKKFSGRYYINGIDIGPKIKDGKETDELFIRFHLEEKLKKNYCPTKKTPQNN